MGVRRMCGAIGHEPCGCLKSDQLAPIEPRDPIRAASASSSSRTVLGSTSSCSRDEASEGAWELFVRNGGPLAIGREQIPWTT